MAQGKMVWALWFGICCLLLIACLSSSIPLPCDSLPSLWVNETFCVSSGPGHTAASVFLIQGLSTCLRVATHEGSQQPALVVGRLGLLFSVQTSQYLAVSFLSNCLGSWCFLLSLKMEFLVDNTFYFFCCYKLALRKGHLDKKFCFLELCLLCTEY